MNIDVTALQTMPELAVGTAGLRPKICKTQTYRCANVTCGILTFTPTFTIFR
jgi:hypothetical protein